MDQRSSKLRSVVAGVLLVAMLTAVPFALLYEGDGDGAVTLPDTAFLRFDGVRISLADDGGIQAFVDVYVQPDETYQYTFMYTFFLKYNDRLWQPSDHDTNAVGAEANFFRYNEELFVLKDKTTGELHTPTDAFVLSSYAGEGSVGSVSVAEDMMYVQFSLDRDRLDTYFDGSQYEIVHSNVVRGDGMGEVSSDEYDTFYYLENVDDNELGIKLGTLSFRVYDESEAETDDREVLRELTEDWDGTIFSWYDNDDYESNTNRAPDINSPLSGSPKVTPPLYIHEPKSITEPSYPWGIDFYKPSGSLTAGGATTNIYVVETADIPTEAAAVISYKFGSELITAKPLLKDVTINAYQAYTYEGPDFVGDDVELAKYNLAIALQKYAPTVEASYVDSRVENFTLNWGAEDTTVGPFSYEHDYTIYERVTGDAAEGYITSPDALPDGVIVRDVIIGGETVTTAWRNIEYIENYEYNPKEGEYIGSQYLYYSAEVDGVPTTLRYPTPMEVHLTVTPVTVERVTADALERNYTQSTASSMNSVDNLQLPDEIRLHTDVVSGAPSLFLEIGSELPVWHPTDLAALKNTDGKTWYVDNNDTTKGVNAGTYPFAIGTVDPNVSDSDDSAAHRQASAVYGSEIEPKYPWLTVKHRYDIEATRTVLPAGTLVHTDYTVEYKSTTADDYQEMLVGGVISDYTSDALTLILSVTRTDAAGAEQAFPYDGKTTGFKVRLPNGLLLNADILDGTGESSYVPDITVESTPATFDITIKPGRTGSATSESDDEIAYREEVRRWINLGGYFEVAVCENVKTYTVEGDTVTFPVTAEENQIWTEFYPVYVPARVNRYEENKEYNFIGLNADLINYPGTFSSTITLPTGEYRPVIVDSSEGTPNTLSTETESYGVLTTYDALTGDQPGRIYTFRVEQMSTDEDSTDTHELNGVWDTETPDSTMASVLAAFNNVSITRYNSLGRNNFAEMVYNAYGRVSNTTDPEQLPTGTTDARPYEPLIRVEKDNAESMPLESVRLIYEGDSAPNNIITATSADGKYENVTTVIFDNKTVGYTVRQSFTLTILNDGETDIDGLYIDSMLDYLGTDTDDIDDYLERDGGGAHFEITDPPASYLPAGAKTTFTITYIFNLDVLDYTIEGGEVVIYDYLDKLYICSNAHGPGELIDFDATFRVEEKEVNRVTVVVLPPFEDSDGNIFYLGEAGVIAGLVGKNMDYTYDSTMRIEDSTVYIGTFPYEEYSVKDIFTNDPDTTLSTTGFEGAYSFQMPGHSITIYVIFEEKTLSKLRPEEINVYAAEDEATVVDRSKRNETRKVLWQKKFDEDESGIANPFVKMQGGAADITGYNASLEHYLVVLEENENYVQADALLRKVKALYAEELSMVQPGNVTYDALKELEDLLGAGYADDYAETYSNTDIEDVNVLMTVYTPADLANLDSTAKEGNMPAGGSVVYNSQHQVDASGTPITDPDTTVGDDKRDDPNKNNGNPGSTADRTRHTSIAFDAPGTGERKWLVITLSHDETDGSTTTTVERSYYIELVRRPSHSVRLDYGNSPVGMIYNTNALVVTDASGNVVRTDGMRTLNTNGEASLKLFVENRDFSKHTSALLPYAVGVANNNLSTEYCYNREAWIPYGELYDPDSLTYTASYSIGMGGTNTDTSTDITVTEEGGTTTVTPVLDEYDTYESYYDLDLDPHSLFIMIGEDFVDPGLTEIRDSSMREVEPERVTRYIRGAEFVHATEEDASDLEGKGFFELAAASNVETADIYLGTLDEGNNILASYWQATHDYQQKYQTIDGTKYPGYVYIPEGGDEDDAEYYFYQPSSGNYFLWDSPYQTIDDAKILYLEPYMEDVDNTALVIRPGVYDLIYEFDDFDSMENDQPIQVVRKLVVLGPVGDATANGTACNDATAGSTASDEKRIETRVRDPLGYDYKGGFDGSNAFKFRTVDVNNDRNVNNIDANELHSALKKIKQFYEPVDYKQSDTVASNGGVSS